MQLRDSELDRFREGEAAVLLEVRWQRRRLGRLIDLEEGLSIGRVVLAEALRSHDPTNPDDGPFGAYVRRRVGFALLDAVRRETHARCSTKARLFLAADLAVRAGVEAFAGQDLTEVETQEARLDAVIKGSVGALAVGTIARRSVAGIAEPIATPEELAMRHQQEEFLRKAVECLPARERTLVQRHFAEDSVREIGADLGLSESWAGRLLEKTLATLRRSLLKLR